MKQSRYSQLFLGFIVFLSAFAFNISCARSQTPPPPPSSTDHPDGCTLSSWVLSRAPGGYRTTELPPNLRDTMLTVNGTAHKISIPAGFTISVFANIPSARGLALSPDGVIYVTSYGDNAIYALPDHNHDGVPDSIIKVMTNIPSCHGIGFYKGLLYYSQPTQFTRVDQTNGRVAANVTAVKQLTFVGDHSTRSFVFDTISNKVYMQIGSSCNMCREYDSTLATVIEMNPDGSHLQIFARGLRNAVGLDIDPRTNALWCNVNGMDDVFGDNRHNDVPYEGIYLLCRGANYGWPYAYSFRMRNPDPNLQIDTGFINSLNGPVAEVLAHEAPLGMHFYRGAKFPASYHNALFQTYHGSWDRTPPAPPRVTLLHSDADGRNATVQDFINGFQPDSSGNRWGRVVSVIEGADSALYISDDGAGVIYRVTWTGPVQTNLFIDNYNLTNQNYTPGSQIPIHWTSNNVDSVTVSYEFRDPVSWVPIVGSHTTNFNWTVPSDFPAPSHIIFKVTDAKSGIESIMDGLVNILSPAKVNSEQPLSGMILESGYPNPFKERTTVNVSTNSDGRVQAELFDILGNKQSVVFDGELPAGEHSIPVEGKGLTPGTYILRLSNDSSTQSIRLQKIN